MLLDHGDPSIERSFRMCVTLCRHRVLTAAERAATPAWFRACRPIHIAGPPVEIFWSRGVPPEMETMRPCLAPIHRPIPGHRAYLLDLCEECSACRKNEETRLWLDREIAVNGGPLLVTR